MSQLDKDKLLIKVTTLIEKYSVTAYEIAKNTNISAAGVGKILNNKSKNPRITSLLEIVNYIEHTYENSTTINQEAQGSHGVFMNVAGDGNKIQTEDVKTDQLKKENKELKKENKELKKELEDVRTQNKKLTDKLIDLIN